MIDAFPYAVEATPPAILALRLAELERLVDVHVIVEATETFTGLPRELSWPVLAQRPEFAPHASRVMHYVIDYPAGLSPWGRDQYTRQAVGRAVADLLGPYPTERVLFGDADEIPRPAVLARALPGQKLLGRYHEWWLDLVGVGSPDHLWEFRQPVLTTWGDLEAYGGEHIRSNSGHMPAAHGSEYGWHFTLQGGAEHATRKLAAYAHTELGGTSVNRVQAFINAERDILDRCGLVSVPMSELPATVREDPARWASMLLPRTRRGVLEGTSA